MSIPYITGIHTNIKFPSSIVINNLSHHVLVTGANGSGKTALLNAVELALTGEARDIGGRSSSRTGSILSNLIPPGESNLFSYVTFSDGTEASWVLERGKRPKHTPPPHKTVLIMKEILGALGGSKLTIARFLIRYFTHKTQFMSQGEGVMNAVEFLAYEEKSRKTLNSWKSEYKALSTALDVLGARAEGASAHTTKVTNLIAMQRLLKLQVDNNLDVCGVCATKTSMATFGARLAKVEGAIAKLGGAQVPERVEALQNALAETQSHIDHATETLAFIHAQIYEKVEEIAIPIFQRLVTRRLDEAVGVTTTKQHYFVGFITEDDDNEAQVCPHVSGAELVRLACAIARTIIETMEHQPEAFFPVVITPDRGIDQKTLKTLMLTLREVPATTILQNPVQPRGRPTTGWTRIILGSEQIEVIRDGIGIEEQSSVG